MRGPSHRVVEALRERKTVTPFRVGRIARQRQWVAGVACCGWTDMRWSDGRAAVGC
jgi:hypothetical protein